MTLEEQLAHWQKELDAALEAEGVVREASATVKRRKK